MSKGSKCLNHASGASGASGPNTVKVLPEPDKPYANKTTALPSYKSALIIEPQASYTAVCPMIFISMAICICGSSFGKYFL